MLVQDRVDRDRRLAGRAVADDQLALAPADVGHRVDRLDAGLERLLHGLTGDHARRLPFDRARLRGLDRAEAVEGISERIDDAPEQSGTDRHRRDLPGAADRVTFRDQVPLAEERHADVVLLEVEGEADDAVVELEHLEGDAVLEPVDTGDPVADLQHRTDFGQVRLDVEVLDPLLQDRGDLFRAQLQVRLLVEFTVRQLLAVASSWRSRSSRPRTLASSRIDPACRTSPPIRASSTERVAWTLRPDACLDLGEDAAELGVRQCVCGGELDVEDPRVLRDERVELVGHTRERSRRDPSARAVARS